MQPHGLISLADFQRIRFVTAKVVSVKVNKTAKVPAYLCSLDVGAPLLEEHKQLNGKSSYFSSAQLTKQHTKEEVDGQTVLVVANFPRKQIGPRMSDCLMTGVQKNCQDVNVRRESTVLVACSHAVDPGTLITLSGVSGQLQTNSRDLLWDQFTAAQVQVGTVNHAEVSNTKADPGFGDLCMYDLQIDFGNSTGVKQAVAVLSGTVFESPQALLNRQVLAVVNLLPDSSTAAVSLLSVAGKSVLQPARQVDNGYILA